MLFLARLIQCLQYGTQEEKAAAMTLLPSTLAQFASITVAASLLEHTPVNEKTSFAISLPGRQTNLFHCL